MKKRFDRFLDVMWAVGSVTFREILRDKVLYNVLVVAALLLGVAFLGSKLTYTQNDRIVLDFGLAGLVLSGGVLAILLGGSMLAKEIERRTILVALSKPVSRTQFLFGKFSGLAAIAFVNGLLLSAAYIGILLAVGGSVSFTLIWALCLAFLQALVLGAIALFFSTLSTTSVAIMMTVGAWLLGTNISQLRFLATKTDNEFIAGALRAFAAVFPNLEHFSLGTRVTYHLPVRFAECALALGYAGVWVVLLVVASGKLLDRREL